MEGLVLLPSLMTAALGDDNNKIFGMCVAMTKDQGESAGYSCCNDENGKSGPNTIRKMIVRRMTQTLYRYYSNCCVSVDLQHP